MLCAFRFSLVSKGISRSTDGIVFDTCLSQAISLTFASGYFTPYIISFFRANISSIDLNAPSLSRVWLSSSSRMSLTISLGIAIENLTNTLSLYGDSIESVLIKFFTDVMHDFNFLEFVQDTENTSVILYPSCLPFPIFTWLHTLST